MADFSRLSLEPGRYAAAWEQPSEVCPCMPEAAPCWLAEGTKYYARMAAKLAVSGKMRWEVGWLKTNPGATVPMWQFPLVYPHL